MSNESEVTFISAEGTRFGLSEGAASIAELIAPMLKTNRTICVSTVTADIMQKIVDWLQHHYETAKLQEQGAAAAGPTIDGIAQWDYNFFCQFTDETLEAIGTAADSLGIEMLEDLCFYVRIRRQYSKVPIYSLPGDMCTIEEDEEIVPDMSQI